MNLCVIVTITVCYSHFTHTHTHTLRVCISMHEKDLCVVFDGRFGAFPQTYRHSKIKVVCEFILEFFARVFSVLVNRNMWLSWQSDNRDLRRG